MPRPLSHLLFATFIAASLALSGCAHQTAAAPVGPKAAVAAETPTAAVPAIPPRQYQGPPPSEKQEEADVPAKSLVLAKQAGWEQVDNDDVDDLVIIQRSTEAMIAFRVRPTKSIGNAVIACTANRAGAIKAELTVSEVKTSPDGLTCWFYLTTTKPTKPGADLRKGMMLAKTVAADKRYSILVLGHWPAKNDSILRKSFMVYVEQMKLIDPPTTQPAPPAPGK